MALKKLISALDALSDTVGEFNVGAVSLHDFKPMEEQIKEMRNILMVQKAHSLLLHAKKKSDTITEIPEADVGTTISQLNEKIAQLQNINSFVNLCLHSICIDDILVHDKHTQEIKKQVQGSMRKLFALNDELISLHQSMIKALDTELELKINHSKSVIEYKKFLEEQEVFRDKKLQETNPELLKNKKKLQSKLRKINIMKRLIKSMIASSNNMVLEQPLLYEMMKKHRDLVSIETIMEMARDKHSSNSS